MKSLGKGRFSWLNALEYINEINSSFITFSSSTLISATRLTGGKGKTHRKLLVDIRVGYRC